MSLDDIFISLLLFCCGSFKEPGTFYHVVNDLLLN